MAAATALERGVRARRRAVLASRAFIGLHLLIVALPIAVIATWAFTNAWPWPDLLPQDATLRGIDEVLAGRGGMGLHTLALSVGIAFAVAALATAVAVLAARALCHFEWRGRTAFRFLALLPFIIPSTVFAMGIQVVFLRIGLGRTVLGVILAHAIVALPYAITIMLDVTAAAGTRAEEAARTLGAGPLQMMRHVTLPQLMPGILSSVSMCYIMSFSQYFLTLLVGGGKVQTFVLVLFPYLSGGDRTIACAYGLVFIVVTFLVFLVFELLLRRFGICEERSMFQL